MAEMFAAAIVQMQKTSIFYLKRRVASAPDDETNESAIGNEMAVSIATGNHVARSIRSELAELARDVMQRLRTRDLYRRTVRELSDMSGRELADLGLHRSEIRRVAFDSVYGARR